jgi:hypothetical protein
MLTPRAFDASKRWYEEAEAMRAVALETANENVRLVQHIAQLEQRVTAAELTPEQILDLGSTDLSRLADHYQALLTAILAELRFRHVDIAEELVAPRVRELEDELAAAKTRIFDLSERVFDLDKQHRQLLASLAEREQPGTTADTDASAG